MIVIVSHLTKRNNDATHTNTNTHNKEGKQFNECNSKHHHLGHKISSEPDTREEKKIILISQALEVVLQTYKQFHWCLLFVCIFFSFSSTEDKLCFVQFFFSSFPIVIYVSFLIIIATECCSNGLVLWWLSVRAYFSLISFFQLVESGAMRFTKVFFLFSFPFFAPLISFYCIPFVNCSFTSCFVSSCCRITL